MGGIEIRTKKVAGLALPYEISDFVEFVFFRDERQADMVPVFRFKEMAGQIFFCKPMSNYNDTSLCGVISARHHLLVEDLVDLLEPSWIRGVSNVGGIVHDDQFTAEAGKVAGYGGRPNGPGARC